VARTVLRGGMVFPLGAVVLGGWAWVAELRL
jgi:hypothetical protein